MVIRPPRSSAEPCGGSCCHSLLGFSVDLCASLLEHPPTVSGAAWISCRRLALKRGRAGSSPLAACLPLLGTQDDPQVGRCGVPGSLLELLISNSLWSPENTSSQVWGLPLPSEEGLSTIITSSWCFGLFCCCPLLWLLCPPEEISTFSQECVQSDFHTYNKGVSMNSF